MLLQRTVWVVVQRIRQANNDTVISTATSDKTIADIAIVTATSMEQRQQKDGKLVIRARRWLQHKDTKRFFLLAE